MSAVQRIDRDLLDSEINWELTPLPAPEPMPQVEMLTEAIVDALSYRLIVCEALDALRKVTIERDRAREENIRFREAARA
jgi:hypothetical protein